MFRRIQGWDCSAWMSEPYVTAQSKAILTTVLPPLLSRERGVGQMGVGTVFLHVMSASEQVDN